MVLALDGPDETAFGTSGARGAPSSNWDVFQTSRRAMELTENANSKRVALSEAYDRRIADVFKATGVKLDNPLLAPPLTERERRARSPGLYDDIDAVPAYDPEFDFGVRLKELADAHPQQAAVIRPEVAVSEDARRLARESEARAIDVGSRGGFGSTAAGLAGGFVGMLNDPAQWAAAVVGHAGAGRSLLVHAYRAAMINAGAEAAIQPWAQAWRAEAGLDYGIGRAATNIAMAGVFGAGLDVAGRSLVRGIRVARGGQWIDPKDVPVAPPERALDAAVQKLPADNPIRKAYEGDAGDLAKALETADDPHLRDLAQRAQDDGLFEHYGIADEWSHRDALAQAVRNAEQPDLEPPPVRVDGELPARRGPDLTDEGGIRQRRFEVDGKPVAYVQIAARDLKIDAERFQFKRAGNDSGVTGALDGATWDRAAAGKLIVFEDADGARFIVDGHQRLDLARRQIAAGSEAPRLDGYVFREADGWAADDVRSLAAQKNIAEGRADVIDAAVAMRRDPSIVDQSLPMAAADVRIARGLTGLSDEAFAGVVSGDYPAAWGAEVARLVSNPARHLDALDAVRKASPDTLDEVRRAIGEALGIGDRRQAQMRLFGVGDDAEPVHIADNVARFDEPAGDGAKRQVEGLQQRLLPADDARAKIAKALRLAEQILGPDQRVRLVDDLADPVTGHAVDGATTAEGDILLSIKALDPAARIGHEGVHALVARGLITPAELRLLAAAGRELKVMAPEWEARYREAYAGRDRLDALIDEEYAAHLIDGRIAGTIEPPAQAAGIIDRVKAFLDRVGNALRGEKMQTADDVINAIMSGEVARRARAAQRVPRAQSTTIKTPDGSLAADAHFIVLDAGDLTAAAGDLQPRDRATRAASDAQIRDMANNLDPDLLYHSMQSDRGAPVIDENGVVLSGNGRVAAIKMARQISPERYQAYRVMMEAEGFDTSGVSAPILVRRVTGLDDAAKREFVVKSNADDKLAMSAAEQARVDRDLLDNDVLTLIDAEGDKGVASAANRSFVRAVLEKMPAAERAAFQNAEGGLSPAGAARIEAAIFARAYDDAALIGRLIEDQEGVGVRNAMIGAAPGWAQMRALAPAEYDVTRNLVDAVQTVLHLRDKKIKLGDFLAQQDAFSELPAATELLMKAFYNEGGNRAAAWRNVREVLKEYAELAIRQADASGDLLGAAPAADDILRGVVFKSRDLQKAMFSFRRSTDRAEAAGYDTARVWYHGTRKDFEAFDPGKVLDGRVPADPYYQDAPRAVFLSGDPKLPQLFSGGDGGRIMPLYTRRDLKIFDAQRDADLLAPVLRDSEADIRSRLFNDADTADLMDAVKAGSWEVVETKPVQDWLRANGYDGFDVIGHRGSEASTIRGIFDTSIAGNIRGVNAAFDPDRAQSSNLMYAFAGERGRPADDARRIDPAILRDQQRMMTAEREVGIADRDMAAADVVTACKL